MGFLLAAAFPGLAGVVAANELSDPTRPSDYRRSDAVVTPFKTPTLNSVLMSPMRRVAVIDGKTYVEGETRGDLTVKNISQEGVDVAIDGRRVRLALDRGPSFKD